MKAFAKNRIFFVLSYLIAFPQTEGKKNRKGKKKRRNTISVDVILASASLQSFRKLCED